MGSKKQHAQNIVHKQTSELIPYEFNNKVHNDKQVDMICNSIAEFGFQNPILVDEKNIVIAGHGRLEAAKKLKLESVPCIVVTGLSDAQIKKLRILDNRIGDEKFSEYNIENLQHELADIADPLLFDLFNEIVQPVDKLSDDFTLPSDEKGEIQTVTFTFHKTQKAEVDRALDIAKKMGDFGDTGNENVNGNALARVCEIFITQNGI